MRRLRALLSITVLCVLAGIAGGLGLGYILSRRGEWLVPQPWVIYAAALLVVTGALTWLDLRRRPAVAVAAMVIPGPTEADAGTAAAGDDPVMAAPGSPDDVPERPAADDGDGHAGGVVE